MRNRGLHPGVDLCNATVGLPRIDMPKESCLISYPDDDAALVVERTVELAQSRPDILMLRVNGWINSYILSLELEKNRSRHFDQKEKPEPVSMPIGELIIVSKPTVKCLGFTLYSIMSFF